MTALVHSVVRWHHKFSWPWRIALAVIGVKFVVELFVAFEVMARVAR